MMERKVCDVTENKKAERFASPLSWQERAARLFVVLSLSVVAYFFSKTLLRLLLPFLLAVIPALIVRPVAGFLERKCRMKHKIASIFVLLLLLLLSTILVVLGCRRLVHEWHRLLQEVGSDSSLWSERLSDWIGAFSRLSEHIPLLSRLKGDAELSAFWEQVDAKLAEILSDTITRYSARIPDLIASLIRAVPGALIFFITFLLSAFYLCADLSGIASAVLSLLPPRWRLYLKRSQKDLATVGGNYLKAYFSLFLLTFFELFVGFSLLGLSYTFLPAILIALVDILPVLGVGTVLVPWGLLELLRGETGTGTGLLVLCAVMMLARQLLEPRIVGKSIGLHPLATLFAAYAGLQLFGLVGMLLGPAVALLVKGWVIPKGAENAKKWSN